MARSIISLAFVSAVSGIDLATFDGSKTEHKFKELNDPVMGGQSNGQWNVDTAGQFGVFDGEVKDVPSLKAPGFIKAAADGSFSDISSVADGDLVLTVRSSTPEYAGFRVSFVSGALSPSYSCAGGGSIPFSRGCFKSKFSVPAGDDFTKIRVPFSSFSDLWSPATGEQTKTCAQDASACATAKKLASIQRFEVWAEGSLGKVHLEIKSISAEASSQKVFGSRPPPSFNTCKGPIQNSLRFGVSTRTSPTVPVAVDPNESLAEAVCCDSRTKAFAEPQFLYEAPDIALFSKISETTIFYDSVCGAPLFRAPANRTMAAFKADTYEHGWPSFRSAEVFFDNVLVDHNTNEVRSACGTHLGAYLPDESGPRWCIDLSCVAGNPVTF